MKLKKIASLALAGVMAVSMLAGCSTNKNDNEGNNGGNSEIVPTSTTATMLREKMNGAVRRVVTAVANSDLDAALQDAVKVYCNNWTVDNFDGAYSLIDIRAYDLGKAVVSDMDAKNTIEALTDKNDKDTVAVEVFAIDGSISDEFVVEMLADRLNGFLSNKTIPEKSADSEYDYDYEVSASIVNASGTGTNKDMSAKFIAFAVTQKVTKVA